MCDIYELIAFAKAYRKLGYAVQEQLDDLIDGRYEMNPDTIWLIKKELGGKSKELDDLLMPYLERS